MMKKEEIDLNLAQQDTESLFELYYSIKHSDSKEIPIEIMEEFNDLLQEVRLGDVQ